MAPQIRRLTSIMAQLYQTVQLAKLDSISDKFDLLVEIKPVLLYVMAWKLRVDKAISRLQAEISDPRTSIDALAQTAATSPPDLGVAAATAFHPSRGI